VTSFVNRAGARIPIAAYTKMVIRTTTREAVSTGTANRMLEAGLDLVTISSHDHEEDECSEYDGETFSLTGATEGFDVLDQYPPFHPNCAHVMAPAEIDLDAFEEGIASASTFAELEAAVGVG
jgi:hypothetical protein